MGAGDVKHIWVLGVASDVCILPFLLVVVYKHLRAKRNTLHERVCCVTVKSRTRLP